MKNLVEGSEGGGYRRFEGQEIKRPSVASAFKTECTIKSKNLNRKKKPVEDTASARGNCKFMVLRG